MSEINDTDEFNEVIFPINLKTTYQYQHKYPSILDKYKAVHAKPVLFVEGLIWILTL